ncbi:MAG: hypothetical protein QOF18_2772 [Frankiaceae bacterium]|nr:hypothetical protein [Frankiaceae bacterium]
MADNCSVEGCDRRTYARGLCEPHYRRRQRTGDVNADRAIGDVAVYPCLVESCRRLATERGLCHAHYLRLLRTGVVGADQPIARQRNTVCKLEACTRPAYARQLCRNHYRRLLRTGDSRAAVPIGERRGNGHLNHGYFIVPVPPHLRHLVNGDTSAPEHRLVMAQMLGRPLLPTESVHHLNGSRRDNRPQNLELWSRWQPSGQRLVDKIEWAVALLSVYAPDRLRSHRLTGESQLCGVPPTGFEPVLPP